MKIDHFLKRVIRMIFVLGLVPTAAGCFVMENGSTKAVNSVSPPDFLMMAAPTTISQENYNKSMKSTITMGRGIVVMINATKIGLAPENRNVEVVGQRASLVVDGQQISRDTLIIADGIEGPGGPYYLSWAPGLRPGLHDVYFQFLTDAGEILEYQWQFEIKK